MRGIRRTKFQSRRWKFISRGAAVLCVIIAIAMHAQVRDTIGPIVDTARVVTRVSPHTMRPLATRLAARQRHAPAVCGGLPIDPSMGDTTVAQMIDSVGWFTGCSPMYTDDQPFNDGAGNYGPVAHIIPSPDDTNSRVAFYNGPMGKFIALIYVDPLRPGETLPSTYSTLHLTVGFNCVYLSHAANVDSLKGWQAYVTPVTGINRNPCPTTHAIDESHLLRVIARQHPRFATNDDYPAVARFYEGRYGRRPNMPLFGLKCAVAWCLVVPNDASPTPSEHVGVHLDSRQWEVFGWNDEQHMPVWSGTEMQPDWTFNASIMAAPKLGERTIRDDFDKRNVHLATIFLKTDPPPGSKYAVRWHLKKGHNFIFIRHTGDDANEGWVGYLSQEFKPTLTWLERIRLQLGIGWGIYALKVNRMPHPEMNPPGTARFKWSYTDDPDWGRCDWGCCEIRPPS